MKLTQKEDACYYEVWEAVKSTILDVSNDYLVSASRFQNETWTSIAELGPGESNLHLLLLLGVEMTSPFQATSISSVFGHTLRMMK